MITHTDIRRHRPTLLIGPRVGAQGEPFRATFSITRSTASRNHDMLKFLFGVEEEGTYNVLTLSHKGGSPSAPSGSRLDDASGVGVAGTRTAANAVSTPNPSDRVWVRVASDGAAVTAKMLLDNTGPPSEAAWSGAGEAYRSTAFPMNGGRVGFRSAYGVAFVRHFTLETDHDNDGSWTREYDALIDHPGGHATIRYEHDAAGNLTFDGVFSYAYDAVADPGDRRLAPPRLKPASLSIRLVSVRNAYREAGASQSVQEGSVVTAMAYDGLGRRTTRAVQNSGNLDFTHHAYFDGQRQVEERNGSDLVLRQQVWGLDYIDELVSTSLNFDPTDTTESVCERHFYALHDSQYNILGIVAAGGALVERYEYTPYGQRQVYGSGWLPYDLDGNGVVDQADADVVDAGRYGPDDSSSYIADVSGDGQVDDNDYYPVLYSGAYPFLGLQILPQNDLKAYTPRLGSFAGRLASEGAGSSLNPFGHQGLHHDEATGLIYNRARMLHPTLGRFVQRDPLGYVDGANQYLYHPALHGGTDWTGTRRVPPYSVPTYQARSTAEDAGSNSLQPGEWGGNRDAIRHCVLMCELAKDFGRQGAIDFGHAYETDNEPTLPDGARGVQGYADYTAFVLHDRAMDLHNNEVGASIGEALSDLQDLVPECSRTCADACADALDNGALLVNVENGYKLDWHPGQAPWERPPTIPDVNVFP
ncbi:hypothetical protein PSMK_08190 [Phycisphaera mikurensis NBRC 102666]|uniref:DUF6973 domain-containing protein n=1 Tax=Phycisphaera mikurensis (strain NBRC 102666 / KCTC 22515 / FYK2301M01) TaxID=1142394 RepID=I0ICJ0_PHYMF|nr:hypothetical protein PSMK_08190 [Phycisphaera mikurensis NBRC 102666]